MQIKPKATRQKASPEWKKVILKDFGMNDPREEDKRAGIPEVSMEISEFKAGGSFSTSMTLTSPNPSRLTVALVKSDSMDDATMAMVCLHTSKEEYSPPQVPDP